MQCGQMGRDAVLEHKINKWNKFQFRCDAVCRRWSLCNMCFMVISKHTMSTVDPHKCTCMRVDMHPCTCTRVHVHSCCYRTWLPSHWLQPCMCTYVRSRMALFVHGVAWFLLQHHAVSCSTSIISIYLTMQQHASTDVQACERTIRGADVCPRVWSYVRVRAWVCMSVHVRCVSEA